MRVWVPANTSDSVLAYATGRRWPTCPEPSPRRTTQHHLAQLRRHDHARIRRHTGSTPRTASTRLPGLSAVRTLLSANATARCYLGGDPRSIHCVTDDTLTPDSTVTNLPLASHDFGWWQKRRSGVYAPIEASRQATRRIRFPWRNANFKGVIFVNGDVALSGRLRGRVSVFATGNIVMADDLLYTNAPGTRCDAFGDIFGAIATKDVIIEDNNLQTPFFVNDKVYGGFDDTNDANYNMFFLAAGDGSTTGNWYGEGVSSPWTHPVAFPAWTGSANSSWDISADRPGLRNGHQRLCSSHRRTRAGPGRRRHVLRLRSVRLGRSAHLRSMRFGQPAAVLPDHRPLRPESLLRDRSGVAEQHWHRDVFRSTTIAVAGNATSKK